MKAVKYVAGLWVSVAVIAAACSTSETTSSHGSTGSASTGSGGAAADCPQCVQDSDCAAGSQCAQLGGDSFCAPACDASGACGSGRTCMSVATVAGAQASLCVVNMGICGLGTSSSNGTTGSGEMCGSLVGPDVAASCTSCTMGAANCQANGCYGGWWCNTASSKCQSPPNPSSCTTVSTTATSSATSGAGGNNGTVGANGGTLDTLNFAIVGDTRPPMEGDIANYPTAIITKIWQDIEAQNPRPSFAVTTGDYQFSNPFSNESSAQFDLYLQARQNYSNVDFPTMGNHECTGGTASNCGQGNANGITQNYSNFISKLLSPIGKSKPYYEIDVNSTMGTWTSKFLFVAANAWDSTQASWLQSAMAKQTTYTFIIRHEGATVTNGPPGLAGSAAIMAQHPYTYLIAGHTHEYRHDAYNKQVIVGNGGAPLTGTSNYGFVVARQRHSDNAIQFYAYDSTSGALIQQFNIKPDGSAAP